VAGQQLNFALLRRDMGTPRVPQQRFTALHVRAPVQPATLSKESHGRAAREGIVPVGNRWASIGTIEWASVSLDHHPLCEVPLAMPLAAVRSPGILELARSASRKDWRLPSRPRSIASELQ
jgi:hypothetical protein